MSDDKPYREGAIGNSGGWKSSEVERIPEYKTEILRMVSDGMFPREIADSLGIQSALIRKWRAEDPDFDAAYLAANEEATDTIEREAIRRARDGVLDVVVSGGRVVMDPDDNTKPLRRRIYSDDLLKFILKGRRRAVYGDQPAIQQTLVMDADGVRSELERKFDSIASSSAAE
jgi:hypothetical protein